MAAGLVSAPSAASAYLPGGAAVELPEAHGPRPTEAAKARSAVLLLHGYTGSPAEVRPLAEALAARGSYVELPLLPGHGDTPEAMLGVQAEDWYVAAEKRLLGLVAVRGPVALVGFSMGGLLSLMLAARYPQAVTGIALLAPGLRIKQIPPGATPILARFARSPLLRLLPRWLTKTRSPTAENASRPREERRQRIPTESLFELFRLQAEAAHAIPEVRGPALIIVAADDGVVANAPALALAQRIPKCRTVTVRGRHIIARDEDRAQAATEVCAFVEQLAG